MSDQQQPSFTDPEGRTFYPDPTGRSAYRAVTPNGRWSNVVSEGRHGRTGFDGKGARELKERPAPRPPVRQFDPQSAETQGSRPDWRLTGTTGRDGVAETLQVLGMLAVVLGGLGAVAGFAEGTRDSDVYAFAGVAVAVQGLLLVGFGRAVMYLRQTVDLLRQAVER